MATSAPFRAWVRLPAFVLLAAALPLGALAQDKAPDPPLLRLKVKSLAAFKNGLGFCVKTGEVSPINGWATLDELPSASLGALWVGTDAKSGAVTDLVAYKTNITDQAPVLSQADLLAANVGQQVRITYSGAALTTVEGVLVGVPAEGKAESRAAVGPSPVPVWSPPPEPSRQGEIVLIRTRVNDQPRILSLNRGLIQAVELAADANLRRPGRRAVNRARIRIAGSPESAEVRLACLEKGIVWSPSYRVLMDSEHTAELTLEAVLANDVEDLEDASVSFVVGYPNFLYADLLSPLNLQQPVAAFIQSLTSERRPERYSPFANTMAQSVAYNTASFTPSERPEAAYAVTQPMAGETSEDLYFYHKSGVTLKKGERARYQIFAVRAPCEHLYQWEVPDNMNVDDRGYRMASSNRQETEPQVWHVLRLQNTGTQPWTTAPAFALNGDRPLAQDVLGYAPPGAKSTLKLTAATEIRAEQSQTEVGRRALQIEGRSLDEVTVAGKLKVTNMKSAAVPVSIKKSLVGEVLKADAGGKVTKVVHKLTSLNPNSEIRWEFQLPAGAEKEVNYECKVLIYR
jgi:hypothetical protein